MKGIIFEAEYLMTKTKRDKEEFKVLEVKIWWEEEKMSSTINI